MPGGGAAADGKVNGGAFRRAPPLGEDPRRGGEQHVVVVRDRCSFQAADEARGARRERHAVGAAPSAGRPRAALGAGPQEAVPRRLEATQRLVHAPALGLAPFLRDRQRKVGEQEPREGIRGAVSPGGRAAVVYPADVAPGRAKRIAGAGWWGGHRGGGERRLAAPPMPPGAYAASGAPRRRRPTA